MGYSAHYDGLAGVVFYAWTAVALIFGYIGTREGGQLCQATPTGRVYRARPAGRVFAAMLGLLFTVGAPLMYASELLRPGKHGEPMPGWGWFPFGLLVSMSISMGLLMFWLAGPNDFFLDLDRRTYCHVYGWAFNQQVKTGSMDDDIAGVFVRCVSMNSRYDVGLLWKRGQKWKRLVMFNRSGRADRCAEETAVALGLPLVAPPPYLKISKDTRTGLG